MKDEIIRNLQQCVGKDYLLTAPEELACYSFDGTGQIYMPDAVALPDSTKQVASLLKLANRYGFPVIPRGAGSGMTRWSSPRPRRSGHRVYPYEPDY